MALKKKALAKAPKAKKEAPKVEEIVDEVATEETPLEESLQTEEPKSGGSIRVKTKSIDSRFRCGMQFGREPKKIELSSLKEGDLERLQADPKLVVDFD